MRLFIAFKTTPIEDLLYEILLKIKNEIKDIKYVRKSNLHITVKFLGETSESKIPTINSVLCDIARKTAKSPFSISGISGFPEKKRARVLFFDVIKGAEFMSQVAIKVENDLSRIGFEKENNFIPHITFARVKIGTVNLEAVKFLDYEIEGDVLGLHLIKSTLTPSGPIYEVLSGFDFNR